MVKYMHDPYENSCITLPRAGANHSVNGSVSQKKRKLVTKLCNDHCQVALTEVELIQCPGSGLLLPILILADSELFYQTQDATYPSNKSLDQYLDEMFYNPDAQIEVPNHSNPPIPSSSHLNRQPRWGLV